ncbi:MAG: non-heme iron oxygenase ferredoxin subunit [Verrucomicrobiales bacterium]|nr:non-heme iron oxygenase ferredoxin subunit [Verrucomicrobiales bacterium]
MEPMVNVADLESIPPGKARTVEVSGRRFALANVDGRVFAIADRCSHRAGPLGEGYLEGCVLHCPLHGWGFDVRTGACDVRPDRPVASYRVEIREGQVWLDPREPESEAA